MTRRLLLGAASAALFIVLATANAGGYRFGASDQAFYLPAITQAADPGRFVHDAELLAVQTRFWLGDELAGWLVMQAGLSLERLAGLGYVTSLLLLAGAAAYFGRGLGASWLAIVAGLALLTMRHRIARTGANSLEGYFHPRMLAFAIGVWALGCVLRGRQTAALVLIGACAIVHSTTALWFGAAVLMAMAWQVDRRAVWAALALMLASGVGLFSGGSRMDAAWLAVLAGKDYLFPSDWPAYAWVVNLAYPAVLIALVNRRRLRGPLSPGELAVVVGLLGLVAGFLISVLLSAHAVALAVQAQVSRVFWILDAITLIYLAAWLVDDWGARSARRWRVAAVAALAAVAAVRGGYVLAQSDRPLFSWTLPADDWTATMSWLSAQPDPLHVLADPGHALKYGSSVRVAARRDTVLEHVKDSSIAMYDRRIASRVAERALALQGFDELSTAAMLDLGRRYAADVAVVESPHALALPVLYRTPRFVVYDLR